MVNPHISIYLNLEHSYELSVTKPYITDYGETKTLRLFW